MVKTQKSDRERFPDKVWNILNGREDKDPRKVVPGIESKESREAVIRYLDHLGGKDCTFATLKNTSNVLRRLSNALEKPLLSVTGNDIDRYFANMKDMAKTTKTLHRVIVKSFYKHGLRDQPKSKRKWVKDIQVKRVEKEIDPRHLLKPDEIKAMIEAAPNTRNKAIVSLLWESGTRQGEFLGLKVGDIEFHGDGSAHISVNGKTGRRRILMITSVPYLEAWCSVHPFRKDKDSYLWQPIYGAPKGKSITGESVSELLKKIGEKAGIEKYIYPHLFRHSRATERSKHWSDATMRKFFGWKKKSTMPSHYSNLADEDLDDGIRKEHGLLNTDEDKNPLEPKDCFNPLCKYKNGVDAVFCQKCGRPLDEDAYRELTEQKNRYEMYRTKLIEKLVNRLDDDKIAELLKE